MGESMLTIHVATEAEPILSHLFGAEFGLEILLEIEKLGFTTFHNFSQLFSDWSTYSCNTRLLAWQQSVDQSGKNCEKL